MVERLHALTRRQSPTLGCPVRSRHSAARMQDEHDLFAVLDSTVVALRPSPRSSCRWLPLRQALCMVVALRLSEHPGARMRAWEYVVTSSSGRPSRNCEIERSKSHFGEGCHFATGKGAQWGGVCTAG